MKREEVLPKYKGAVGKLRHLRSIEPAIYKTMHKHVPGAGSIPHLETELDVVICHAKVNGEVSHLKNSCQELGVSLKEKDYNFMGFSLDVWNQELKTRLEEIRVEKEILRLEKLKTTLSKHLSADDLFEIEMSSIGADLSDLSEFEDNFSLED